MTAILCKLIKSLSDLVRYLTAGIVIVLLLPLSLIVFFVMALSGAITKAYMECYRLMYEMLKLVLGRQKVRTVVLKEGQAYDEDIGVYYTDTEVCVVCNCEECECKESGNE